ncbi:MAG: NUDIX hydrolase [Desulfobacterales bacterium]|nr:NUDIX hydrolase [Desulfobacterales bacterium]
MKNNQLLLVHHFEKRTGEGYWLPPGGATEISDSSIFECAIRETREETGLEISASRIIYVREFIDYAYDFRNLELFILADTVNGEPSVRESWPAGRDYPIITEIRWFTKAKMTDLTVYPEQLKTQFWDDIKNSFFSTKHLGTKIRLKSGQPVNSEDPKGRAAD